MYGGVEFFPLPEPVYTALCANPKMKKWKDKGLENVALSTRIMSKQGCTNICKQAFEFAKDIENAVQRKYEIDVEPIQALKQVAFTRYDIEIKLHVARKAAGLYGNSKVGCRKFSTRLALKTLKSVRTLVTERQNAQPVLRFRQRTERRP